MRLFVFARCVCFYKSRVFANNGGRLRGSSYPSKNELRDLCEVEFWEVCVVGGRYDGLFNVCPHATPHYQIVDLESISFRCLNF